MNESYKALLGLAVAVCGVIGIVVWIPALIPKPGLITWSLRLLLPLVSILCLVIVVRAHRRKDLVPDFLSSISPHYFERKGLCFVVTPMIREGHCWMDVHFQNRYDKPCSGKVCLRPRVGFLGFRKGLKDLEIPVACGPAEYGRSSSPWAIPAHLRGKKVTLEVSADIVYPEGRGNLVRFREGLSVRPPKPTGRDAALVIAGAVAGTFVIVRPAKLTFVLPSVVAPTVTAPIASTQILWSMGQPIETASKRSEFSA